MEQDPLPRQQQWEEEKVAADGGRGEGFFEEFVEVDEATLARREAKKRAKQERIAQFMAVGRLNQNNSNKQNKKKAAAATANAGEGEEEDANDDDNDGDDDSKKPAAEMTLEDHEKKWGFSLEDLKTATRVVTTLYHNPSMYVDDAYLAESNLFSMLGRDKRVVKNNHLVYRYEDNKNKKENSRRAADLALIKKTTMKRERDDALTSILGDATNTHQYLLLKGGKDGNGDGSPLLLTEGPSTPSASTNDADVSAAASPLAAAMATKEQALAEVAAAAAAAKKKLEDADASTEKTQQQQQNTNPFVDNAFYHLRCLAGLELIEVIHHPQELIPIVSMPKPYVKKSKDVYGDGDDDDNNDNDEKMVKAKQQHQQPGQGKKWQRPTAVSHADVQNWRCHLTTLYHRFWPLKELTTQMTRPFAVADTWRPLIPNISGKPTGTGMRMKEGSAAQQPLVTVDTIHHELCVMTARMSLFLSSLLDEEELGVASSSGSNKTSASPCPATAEEDTLQSEKMREMTYMLDYLQACPHALEAHATCVDDRTCVAAFLDEFLPHKSNASTAFGHHQNGSSAIDAIDIDDEGAAAADDDQVEAVEIINQSKAAKLISLFSSSSSSADDGTNGGDILESTLVPQLSDGNKSAVAGLRAAIVVSDSVGGDASAADAPAATTSVKALLAELRSIVAVAAKSATPSRSVPHYLPGNLLCALDAVLSPKKRKSAKSADDAIATAAEERARLWVYLLQLLGICLTEHWGQYKRAFAAVHSMAALRAKNGGANSASGGGDDDAAHFDPEAKDNNDNYHQQQNQQQQTFSSSAVDEIAKPYADPHCANINAACDASAPTVASCLLARASFPLIARAVTAYYAAFVYKNEKVTSTNTDTDFFFGAATPTAGQQEKDTTTTAAGGAATGAVSFYIHNRCKQLFNGVKLSWLGFPPEPTNEGHIEGENGLYLTATTATGYSVIPYSEALTCAAPNKREPLVSLRREMTLEQKMHMAQKCYSCRGKFAFLHPYYYALCRPCSEYNYNKRLITRDLRGKVVLLTGTRIKIGYAMAVSLLRCGATLIGTTRFTMDATNRFAAEPDYEEWRHRLHLYSVDLRDMWMVTQFCNFISRKFPKLFAIVNNAAQTIARTAAYTADLRRLEANPPERLVETFSKDKSATEWRQFFFEHSSVTVGQSLHLEYHPTQTPVVEGEFTSENTQLRTNSLTGVVGHSLKDAQAFSAAAESFLVNETAEQKLARLARDGGDAIGTAVMSEQQLATTLAKRSDRYDTFAEESDKRVRNSWSSNLAEVQGSEAAEVMAINALSPFILNSRLKPLLMNRDGEEDPVDPNHVPSNREKRRESNKWGARKSSRFIINVSAMEGQFYRYKGTTHPHTNMAKAALNMMTRTSAEDYARDGIYMNSVDTGWITDESPASIKARRAEDELRIPIDEVDAAARCLDLIYVDSREYGKFWKDYKVIPW